MATREEIASVLRSGTAARRTGRLSEALACMNEAAALCAEDQDYERAHVLRELGELARHNGDLKAAQTHYEQATALLRNSEDQLKFAHTIRHLGDVHADQQHWLESERCLSEALAIYRSHPSPVALELANAVRAHAALKTETGQHQEARALWAEACKLYESQGITAGVEECRRRADQLG
jgi:tetratricopeptide (TPR) repeat protein